MSLSKAQIFLCDFCVQNGRDGSRKDNRTVCFRASAMEKSAAHSLMVKNGWRVYPAENKLRCPLCVRDKILNEQKGERS
jgi:hypothetical protein